MQFPLHIELRRSRILSSLMVLLHSLACGCLFLLPWPAEVRYAAIAGLALSVWWYTLRPSTVVGLRLGERGELGFLLRGGECLAASVRPDTAVFGQLVVLRARHEDGSRIGSLALFPDSMLAEHFRLLRLWLRWLTASSGRPEGGV